jgi:hypothetical protein
MDEQTSTPGEPTATPPVEPVPEVAPETASASAGPVTMTSETETSAVDASASPVPTLPPETEKAQSVGNEPFPLPATPPPVVVSSPVSRVREFLQMARESLTGRKTKKLEKILAYIEKHGTITNDEVEKLLHVSDATATRYLSALEKDGRIVQTGARGRGVSYRKV